MPCARSSSGLGGALRAPLGPVAAALVPRCALLPAPTPRMMRLRPLRSFPIPVQKGDATRRSGSRADASAHNQVPTAVSTSRGVAAGRSAQRGTSAAATGGGGRSAPDPDLAPSPDLPAFEDNVAHELLGDGGGAAAALTGYVNPRGAQGRAGVEAGVLVEAGILGGQRRLEQVRRHVAQRDDRALAARRIVDLPQQLPLAIEDLGGFEAQPVGIVQNGDGRQLADYGEEGDAGGNATQDDQEKQTEQEVRDPGALPSPRCRRRVLSFGRRCDRHSYGGARKARSMPRPAGARPLSVEGGEDLLGGDRQVHYPCAD